MLQVVCWESKFLQSLLYLPLQFPKGLTWLVTSWQINAARLSRCIQAEDICSCAAECLGASRLPGQMWWDPVCAVPMGDASTPSALRWGSHWGTKLRALGAAPAPSFAIQLPLRGFPAALGEANPFDVGSCRVMCQQSEESILWLCSCRSIPVRAQAHLKRSEFLKVHAKCKYRALLFRMALQRKPV